MTLEQREALVLKEAGGAASRSGCRLNLRLKSGATLRLDDYDDGACANPPRKRWLLAHKVDWYHHYLESYDPKCGLFVVMIRYDENDDRSLIDERNGRQTRILGDVSLSPKCGRALEITPESEAGVDSPNAIRIWRRVGSKFVLEWQYLLHWGASPGLARWVDEDNVLVACTNAGGELSSIRRRAQGWGFDPGKKAECIAPPER